MKREITVDGKPCQVEITDVSVGSPFKVKVNDKPREVLLEREPSSGNFTLKVDKESYSIELPTLGRNAPFTVKVNTVPFNVEIKSATARAVVSTPSFVSVQVQRSTKAAAEGAVVAPMAGKIVSVRVKKGDAVKMDAVLCVLEAMKMENEITTPKAGTVREVYVSEGSSVSEGEPLFMIG